MIEADVIQFLAVNQDIPVFAEVPTNPPDRFIVVEKTGGGVSNMLYQASIAVQSYGKTLLDSATINEDVKEVMERLVELPLVSRSELNTDYNYTDMSTKRHRYQAVFEVSYFYE